MSIGYVDISTTRETPSINDKWNDMLYRFWVKDHSRTMWHNHARVVTRTGKLSWQWYCSSNWIILSWYIMKSGILTQLSTFRHQHPYAHHVDIYFVYCICIYVSKGIKKMRLCWSRVNQDLTGKMDRYEY